MIKMQNCGDGFLRVVYDGHIDMQQIIKHINSLIEDSSLPENLKILTDARQSRYLLQKKEGDEVIRYMRQNTTRFNSIKSAILHSSPWETAMATLLQDHSNILNFQHRVFSTEEAAISWLR